MRRQKHVARELFQNGESVLEIYKSLASGEKENSAAEIGVWLSA